MTERLHFHLINYMLAIPQHKAVSLLNFREFPEISQGGGEEEPVDPSCTFSKWVVWLGLCALIAEDLGSIPGWGTKIPQARWHDQIEEKPSRQTTCFCTTLALAVNTGRTKTDSTGHEGCKMLKSRSGAGCGDYISRTSQHLVKPSC